LIGASVRSRGFRGGGILLRQPANSVTT
jgi:hypothetical protein